MDISKNKRAAYYVGHNPSLVLTGTTKERVYIVGTGRLDLDLSQVSINSDESLLIEGFDFVKVYNGVLVGGIIGIKNKSYSFSNLVVYKGRTGILINSGDIDRVDMDNVHLIDSMDEGFYFGQSRASKPHIKELIMTRCSAINSGKDGLQIGATAWADVKECTFISTKKRPFGHDKDIMGNPYSQIRLTNCTYKSLFSHEQCKINIV